MENKLKWFGTVLEWIQKYSIWSFLKAGFVMIFVSYVMVISLNPGIIYERVVDYVTEIHNNDQSKRLDASVRINYILNDLMRVTNADRAWVIEYHNGTSGLGGLPFTYGIMNSEIISDDVNPVSSHYKDFLLSEYPFILETSPAGGWIGNVEDIQNKDRKLYYAFKSNSITNIAWFYLKSEDKDIGVIGISYCNNEMPEDVWVKLREAGIRVSVILNK